MRALGRISAFACLGSQEQLVRRRLQDVVRGSEHCRRSETGACGTTLRFTAPSGAQGQEARPATALGLEIERLHKPVESGEVGGH